MDARQERGLIIAAKCRLRKQGEVWSVPSQTINGQRYTVDVKAGRCTCPDHQEAGHKCKHIYAVEYTIEREYADDGAIVSQTETLTIRKRKTYPQNWRAYNSAQTNEKAKLQSLLHELCSGVQEPAAGGRGRPRIGLRDGLFAACLKVYSTLSCRRFMSDLQDAHGKGYIRRVPSYNSIFNVFEAESTSPVLKALVIESANPLKAIETRFACDSSGFCGSRFDRWYDHKFGEHKAVRSWVKAHIMTGVTTNVITAVEIHGKDAADSPQLKPLLASTAERFGVRALAADAAYSSEANLQAIVDMGAEPLIPFRVNANFTRPGIWNKCFHFFNFHREEFLSRYHMRSNVESTFSMIKRKFGDGVRSKTDVAMRNEVLAKFVCHNICCLIQAMYELGVDPVFWAEAAPA